MPFQTEPGKRRTTVDECEVFTFRLGWPQKPCRVKSACRPYLCGESRSLYLPDGRPATFLFGWMDTTGLAGTLTARYTIAGQEFVVPLELQGRPQKLGGVRWFVGCPKFRPDGTPCDKFCSRLYLPPDEWLLGCRVCHRLGYTSSQESHRFDRLYRDIGREIGLSLQVAKDLLEHPHRRGPKRSRPPQLPSDWTPPKNIWGESMSYWEALVVQQEYERAQRAAARVKRQPSTSVARRTPRKPR